MMHGSQAGAESVFAGVFILLRSLQRGGSCRLAASACTILSQPPQASFGRTCRITLKCSGTYFRVSEASSPRDFNSPPQSGHASCFGRILRVSRGRCAGSGRRADFVSHSDCSICRSHFSGCAQTALCRCLPFCFSIVVGPHRCNFGSRVSQLAAQVCMPLSHSPCP